MSVRICHPDPGKISLKNALINIAVANIFHGCVLQQQCGFYYRRCYVRKNGSADLRLERVHDLLVRFATAEEISVFQPDNHAPAHRAHQTVELYFVVRSPEFIASDMWPPNSVDLNPVDYCIFGQTQKRVYHTPI